MKIRILARVIIFAKDRILLVKNRGMNFWYPPGGEWEFKKETIIEAAKREVKEETGLDVEIIRLLYLQEFHPNSTTIFFETFWLGKPHGKLTQVKNWKDLMHEGLVEEARWFTKDEIQNLQVFPKRLKTTFWERINKFLEEEDPFIGVLGLEQV
jgi:ADP-ribose pyrophosphatase YjhB (NUDIX family)